MSGCGPRGAVWSGRWPGDTMSALCERLGELGGKILTDRSSGIQVGGAGIVAGGK